MIALTPILFSLFGCSSTPRDTSADMIGKNADHIEKSMSFGTDQTWDRHSVGTIVSATETEICIDTFEFALVDPKTNTAASQYIYNPPEPTRFCGSAQNYLIENSPGQWLPITASNLR